MRISANFTSAFSCRSMNYSGVCNFDSERLASLDYFRDCRFNGWVTERSIVHAWKACVPKGTGGSNPPPSVSIVDRARKVACITVSHNKSADFRRNPTLSFEVSSDRETGE